MQSPGAAALVEMCSIKKCMQVQVFADQIHQQPSIFPAIARWRRSGLA
jgi:hypothetical protein